MNVLTVLQHTSSEYLGLVEDHLEGRRIRFRYCRPFSQGVDLPRPEVVGDGLIMLGGGPWGAAGGRDLPTLAEEVSLARACLMLNKIVIGFGLGAQILSLAADGGVDAAPLEFSAADGRRIEDDALNGYLPERFPQIIYMRDRPAPPAYARILAIDEADRPSIFQIGERAFGFSGHPGFKPAMAEDLIMEFEEGPEDPGPTLAAVRTRKRDVEDALVAIMTGLVQAAGMMRT